MALFLNRARETTTTTGTGTLNLDGAVSGARTAVAAALAADNGAGGSSPFSSVRYLIQADDGNMGDRRGHFDRCGHGYFKPHNRNCK